MSTSNGRMTLGSIFGMVTTAANAVSSTINAGVEGVEMLSTYVEDASKRQKSRSKLEMAEFEEVLLEEMAQQASERDLKVMAFCSKSKQHAELYESNYQRLKSILHPSTNT